MILISTGFFNLVPDNKKHILLARLKGAIATGDVPFEGQSVVGRDDIRGYTNGKHRDDQIYALQTEYRWRVYKKWGVVAFGGVAESVEYFKDLNFSNLLPGIGAGIRYEMLPSENINIGIDLATGKDDWGIYFRIGEAFGR